MDIHINVILPPNATLPSFSTYLPRFQQMIGEPGKEPLKLSTLSLGGPVDQLSLNGVRQFIDRGVDVRMSEEKLLILLYCHREKRRA